MKWEDKVEIINIYEQIGNPIDRSVLNRFEDKVTSTIEQFDSQAWEILIDILKIDVFRNHCTEVFKTLLNTEFTKQQQYLSKLHFSVQLRGNLLFAVTTKQSITAVDKIRASVDDGFKEQLTYVCDHQRHLVCLPYSVENLHRMAGELNIKRHWYHVGGFPHYDIPMKRIGEIQKIATITSAKNIVKIIKGQITHKDQL